MLFCTLEKTERKNGINFTAHKNLPNIVDQSKHCGPAWIMTLSSCQGSMKKWEVSTHSSVFVLWSKSNIICGLIHLKIVISRVGHDTWRWDEWRQVGRQAWTFCIHHERAELHRELHRCSIKNITFLSAQHLFSRLKEYLSSEQFLIFVLALLRTRAIVHLRPLIGTLGQNNVQWQYNTTHNVSGC